MHCVAIRKNLVSLEVRDTLLCNCLLYKNKKISAYLLFFLFSSVF